MKKGIKKSIFIGVIIILLYTIAYTISYANRAPAANMAYWMYTSSGDSIMSENIKYYFFYPAYKIHRILPIINAGRHNWDREPYVFIDAP
jgi:hypothetical protein